MCAVVRCIRSSHLGQESFAYPANPGMCSYALLSTFSRRDSRQARHYGQLYYDYLCIWTQPTAQLPFALRAWLTDTWKPLCPLWVALFPGLHPSVRLCQGNVMPCIPVGGAACALPRNDWLLL